MSEHGGIPVAGEEAVEQSAFLVVGLEKVPGKLGDALVALPLR
jgi:hypothetical protein